MLLPELRLELSLACFLVLRRRCGFHHVFLRLRGRWAFLGARASLVERARAQASVAVVPGCSCWEVRGSS